MMICIPVTAGSEREAFQKIRKAVPLADFIELRMDVIVGGDIKKLIDEIRHYGLGSTPTLANLATLQAAQVRRYMFYRTEIRRSGQRTLPLERPFLWHSNTDGVCIMS